MERLILCGGGHVSLEVAHIARRLEFELVVIDDRPEFASRERFPMADQVVCAPFPEALDALGSRESDYYVILTRGHAHERDCLEHVLRGKYAYAGMIGSRTKVAAVKAALEAAGIAREILDGVHSPIGLPIGAQTPAEIAVSIAAELVQEGPPGPAARPRRRGAGRAVYHHRQAGAGAARRGRRPRPGGGEPGVLCTITAKRGSPRGVGTWMLVRPDGTVLGTIGGGAVEHLAVQEAKALWAHGGGPVRRHYDLTPARPSWAWCAGRHRRGIRGAQMKEITLFLLNNCPHCKLALRLQEELLEEHPRGGTSLRMVDEAAEPAYADTFDYYYVPCYYVDGVKVHEGHAERADVEAVFRAAAGEPAGV